MQYHLTFGKKITEQILIHRVYVILTSDFSPLSCSQRELGDCRSTERQNKMFSCCGNSPVLIIINIIFKRKNTVWHRMPRLEEAWIYYSEERWWGRIQMERRATVPFRLKCGETQKLRFRDLPYCRHMALHCDAVCVRVSRQGERERRGKAFVSATWICPRALWVITEKQQLCFFGTWLIPKCGRWDLLLLLCHYVSRLMIV